MMRSALGAEAQARLGRGLAPRLLQQPIEASLDNSAVPPRIIEQLAVMQANAVTPEVQPTTLGEFLAAEADRIRVAAAQALVALVAFLQLGLDEIGAVAGQGQCQAQQAITMVSGACPSRASER